MSLSTHVLDTALGRPAADMAVRLDAATADGWTPLASARTDQDGRTRDAFVAAFDGNEQAGRTYRLVFDTAGYFADRGVKDFFYPEVAVCFTIVEPGAHYHVPLLLSPFGYSTYRGT